jgi:hypothetical protein
MTTTTPLSVWPGSTRTARENNLQTIEMRLTKEKLMFIDNDYQNNKETLLAGPKK